MNTQQENFIKDNHLKMSIRDMSITIGLSFYSVRNYMKNNNLVVPKETIQRIRIEKIQRRNLSNSSPKEINEIQTRSWVSDPWNHGLNLVTMLPQNKNLQ